MLSKNLCRLSHECQAVQFEAYLGVYFILNKIPDLWYQCHHNGKWWTHSFGNIWIHFHYNIQMTQTQATTKKRAVKMLKYEGKNSFQNQDCSILNKGRDNFPLSMNIKKFHMRVLTSCLGPSHCSSPYTQVCNVQRASFPLISHTCVSSCASRGVSCPSSPRAAALILWISTLTTPTFRINHATVLGHPGSSWAAFQVSM